MWKLLGKMFDYITEIGEDKALHFFVGAWIVAMLALFGYEGILAGFVIAVVLSTVKECMVDEKAEWQDILATGLGALMTAVIYVIVGLVVPLG